MPQRRNLLQPEGSHRRHRAMAQSIQHDPTALILELSAASTPNIHSPIASPGSQLPDAIVSIPLVQNIREVTQTVAAAEQLGVYVVPTDTDSTKFAPTKHLCAEQINFGSGLIKKVQEAMDRHFLGDDTFSAAKDG